MPESIAFWLLFELGLEFDTIGVKSVFFSQLFPDSGAEMFPVLPPLGGVRLLGRAAVTAVNHNNVISRSYWSGEQRAGHTVRHAETLGEILSSSRGGE